MAGDILKPRNDLCIQSIGEREQWQSLWNLKRRKTLMDRNLTTLDVNLMTLDVTLKVGLLGGEVSALQRQGAPTGSGGTLW
jgi:hypothetical protein